MTGRKNTLIAVLLFGIALAATGFSRVRLDEITTPFRDGYPDFMYLPAGTSLKIMAFGFDAPLADALFIRGIVYYTSSLKNTEFKDATRDYTYEQFNVITDLSPRFTRAYQLGALFLTGSALENANLNGIRLLEKGVATATEEAEKGQPLEPDPRWLFHAILANAFDVNIQAHRRKKGDLVGAGDARKRAAQEFRLGASSPGAPVFMAAAASGYESKLSGTGDISDSLNAVLAVWVDIHNKALERGDKDILPMLEERIDGLSKELEDIHLTKEMEKHLTAAGKEYLRQTGEAPSDVDDLVAKKLIPGIPKTFLDTEEKQDVWLALPDGSFKSALLAENETDTHLDFLVNIVMEFTRVSDKEPTPENLIAEGFIKEMPVPPLALLGQKYYLDESGIYESEMPEGITLP